jgi:hypothetical protein
MSNTTAAPTPLKMAKTGLTWLLCPFVVSGMVDGAAEAGGRGPIVGGGAGGVVGATCRGKDSAAGRDHAVPPPSVTSSEKVTNRPAVTLPTPSV